MIIGDDNNRLFYNREIIKIIKENCLGFFRERFDIVLNELEISKNIISLERSCSMFDAEIIEQLEKAVENYSDMRFLQLLINFGYVRDNYEEWIEESKITYDRLCKILNQPE